MSTLSSRLKHVKDYSEKLQNLKMETAMQAMDTFMNTDQFKMAIASLPNSMETVSAIVEATVKAVTDPSADFLDILRAKGFRSGEIRTIVRRLYNTYCSPIDTRDESSQERILYEDMLPVVAEYATYHPDVYSSLRVEELRAEG